MGQGMKTGSNTTMAQGPANHLDHSHCPCLRSVVFITFDLHQLNARVIYFQDISRPRTARENPPIARSDEPKVWHLPERTIAACAGSDKHYDRTHVERSLWNSLVPLWALLSSLQHDRSCVLEASLVGSPWPLPGSIGMEPPIRGLSPGPSRDP